jgi:DNA (cytosine-5)-methyltransferase 3A
MKEINVLSCFDGASCGQLALKKLGVPVGAYYASEVDPYAIKVTQANYPNTIQLGDITKVGYTSFNHHIDLMMGGSPCQGFSFAGKQLNFDDPRSRLFFDFIRIRDELLPKYVLLENVRMSKESQDVISKYMGCEPTKINSSLLPAQSRNRLYWFVQYDWDLQKYVPIHIEQPQDRGIKLKDILEDLPFCEIPQYLANNWSGSPRGDRVKSVDDDKANCLTASMYKGQIPTFIKKPNPTMSKEGLLHVGTANLKGHDSIKRVYSDEGKSPTLTTMGGGHREPKISMGRVVNRRLDENGVRKDNQMELPFTTKVEVRQDDLSNCLTTVEKDNVVVNQDEYLWRKLTPLECERLQTMPDNYTNHVSKTQRYKMIGNGWTVDVIAHILNSIKVIEAYDDAYYLCHKVHNETKEQV